MAIKKQLLSLEREKQQSLEKSPPQTIQINGKNQTNKALFWILSKTIYNLLPV